MALTKYCFTCKSPLAWISKEGVGKYNGFYGCPNKCKLKFDPNNSYGTPDAIKRPINDFGGTSGVDPMLLLTDEVTGLRSEIKSLSDFIRSKFQ